jgi:hypothetical protein
MNMDKNEQIDTIVGILSNLQDIYRDVDICIELERAKDRIKGCREDE